MEKKKLYTLISILLLIIMLIIILLGTFVFKSYDVIFDSKGGTSVAAERVMTGKTVKEPDTPVLKGYIFDGWYLDGEKYDFDAKVTEDITLTGKWTSLTTPVE